MRAALWLVAFVAAAAVAEYFDEETEKKFDQEADQAGLKSAQAKTVKGALTETANMASAVADSVNAAVDDVAKFAKIGKVLGAVGPLLGAVGPAFALLDLFLLKGDSPELKFMKEQFTVVNEKLDDIDGKLNNVMFDNRLANLEDEYFAEVHNPISDMRRDHRLMLKEKMAGTTKKDFIDTCERNKIRGIRTYIRNRMLDPGKGRKMLDTVKDASKWSMEELKSWMNQVSMDLAEVAVLHAAYQALRDDGGELSVSEREIYANLSRDLAAELEYQVEAYKKVPFSIVKAKIKEKAEEVMHRNFWTMNSMQGWDIALAGQKHYPFLKFGCLVTNSTVKGDCEKSYCIGGYSGFADRRFWKEYGDKRVACAWSKTLTNRDYNPSTRVHNSATSSKACPKPSAKNIMEELEDEDEIKNFKPIIMLVTRVATSDGNTKEFWEGVVERKCYSSWKYPFSLWSIYDS